MERVKESVHNGLKLNPPKMLRVRGRRSCQQHLVIFYLCKHDLCHVCSCSVSCCYTFQRSLCCEFRHQYPVIGNSSGVDHPGQCSQFRGAGLGGIWNGQATDAALSAAISVFLTGMLFYFTEIITFMYIL